MKKIIATILTLAMLLTLAVVATTSVSAQSEPWDGVSTAESFSSGTGTAEDPYIIMTGAELNKLSLEVTSLAGSCFKLGDDINLGGNIWMPIGPTSDNFFSGVFDGNGKTVYNFFVSNHPAGLFGVVGDSTISDLKIDHATIRNTANNICGAIAGKSMRSTIENIEIGENVVVGNGAMASGCQVGGIIGQCTDHCTVKNVINRAAIDALYGKATSYAAGIIGLFGGDSTLDGAINYGNISYSYVEEGREDKTLASGIIGATGNGNLSGTVKNVINYGAVNSVSYASGIIGRVGNVDGLIAENCFNLNPNIVGGKNADGVVTAGLVVAQVSFNGTFTNCISITNDSLLLCGIIDEGKSCGEANGIIGAASEDEIGFVPEFVAVKENVAAAMPTWNEVTIEEAPDNTLPDDTGDEPVDTPADTPADTPVETPADTPVDTPADTGDKTEPTTPETDPTTPETEKPAEGGCGSVVAGGLAILAVVTLAGVALKKKD